MCFENLCFLISTLQILKQQTIFTKVSSQSGIEEAEEHTVCVRYDDIMYHYMFHVPLHVFIF